MDLDNCLATEEKPSTFAKGSTDSIELPPLPLELKCIKEEVIDTDEFKLPCKAECSSPDDKNFIQNLIYTFDTPRFSGEIKFEEEYSKIYKSETSSSNENEELLSGNNSESESDNLSSCKDYGDDCNELLSESDSHSKCHYFPEFEESLDAKDILNIIKLDELADEKDMLYTDSKDFMQIAKQEIFIPGEIPTKEHSDPPKILIKNVLTSEQSTKYANGIIPSKEQLLLLLEEKRKAQETNKRVCWADAAKILNAKGPSIKSAIRWRRCYYWELRRIRRKIRNGAKITQLEMKVKELAENDKKNRPSEKQLLMLLEEKAKQTGKKTLWADISKVLNAEGPCIKSGKNWSAFYYKHGIRIRKKIQEGAKLTKLEKEINVPAKKEKTYRGVKRRCAGLETSNVIRDKEKRLKEFVQHFFVNSVQANDRLQTWKAPTYINLRISINYFESRDTRPITCGDFWKEKRFPPKEKVIVK